MVKSPAIANQRVLVIDDNPAIHEDFCKILGDGQDDTADLAAAEATPPGQAARAAARPRFEIDSALQGQEGVARATRALGEGRPYAMAFVDMRMPPGWDGLETLEG